MDNLIESKQNTSEHTAALMEKIIKELLINLNEDPTREGLKKTPERVARSLEFLTSGYRADVNQIINKAIFTEHYEEMVLVNDIDFYSLCEHHMLPFYGKCHIGYIPKGKIIGLSKIPRLVDVFARRLQVQERMTTQIAETLVEHLQPAGVAVVVEAHHLCMMMRGVSKQNTLVKTSSIHGIFREDQRTRDEFMNLIANHKP